MKKKKISPGVVHKVPFDFKKVLLNSSLILDFWNNLTPLARNEWICWILSVKKPETRKNHIQRAYLDLLKGKHRPCCWPGCPHRQKYSS